MHFCGKKFGFFEIPRRYCHTDSQAAAGAVSITSMQNWPHGQIRLCYAKSGGKGGVHLIRKPPPLRKTVGFPNPCDNENNIMVWHVSGFTASISSLQN